MTHISGGPQKLFSDILRQIVADLHNGEAYKSWDGVPTETVLSVPGKIVVRITSAPENAEGKCLKLKVFLQDTRSKTEVAIPWGIGKYMNDTDTFFASFGISKGYGRMGNSTRPVETYSGHVVNVTIEGNIVVAQKYLSIKNLRAANIANALDLRPEDVSGDYVVEPLDFRPLDREEDVPVGEVSRGLDDDTLLMVEVALGAFVDALIISLIGLLFTSADRREI
jgi:hypothetical protein